MLILAAITCIAIESCKKDTNNNTTPDFNETLKNTVWGGKYYDLTNAALQRVYSIRLDPDKSFNWIAYDPSTLLKGTWNVIGKTIIFKFSTGAKNEWSGQIDGDNLINITDPVPAGFVFISCKKQ